MQKSKLGTALIILGILIYGLISNIVLIYKINTVYLYIINPLFWILLSGFLFLSLGKSHLELHSESEILQYMNKY